MNVKLLQEVRDTILAEPRKLNMDRWLDDRNNAMPSYRLADYHAAILARPDVRQDQFTDVDPPCGTIGCIAGWAVSLSNKGKPAKEVAGEVLESGEDAESSALAPLEIKSSALALLEIDSSPAHSLFYVSDWPQPFRDEYNDAERNFRESADTRYQTAMAQVTARRIDAFIAEHGPEAKA